MIKPLDGRKPRLLLPGSPTISCQVRCVTYLPGQRLADVPATSTRWRDSATSWHGSILALADFIEPRADRPFLWDIQRVEQLRPLIDYVRDPLRRERVLAVIDEFSSDVGPRMRELDRQVIHNDANPQNVLVALDDPDRISGVIDFGDAVHGPSAQELAVAIAYQPLAGVRPFAAAAEMARGYHELRPLSERELMLLPALIATRLALTTVITAWRSALHPKNAGYIMRNDETIEVNLALVSALSGHDGTARFVASVLDPGSGQMGRI